MEPLISPWFFYLLYFVDSIKEFGLFLIPIYAGANFFLELAGHEEEKEADKTNKGAGNNYDIIGNIKKLVIKFFIAIFMLIIVPDQKTIITMYIARHVTPNNIKKVQEVIYEARDELIKTIKEFKEGSETASDARSD